jgi:tetratricopeptide (TPR) repeat protein
VTQAHTDSEGRFGFEVGQLTGITPDATQEWASAEPGRAGGELGRTPGLLDQDHSDRIAARSLAGCSLQASLAGFRSSVVPIGLRNTFDDPDVGVIVLEPRHSARGLPISVESLRAPERARDAYERGLQKLGEGDLDGARKHLERSLREFPDHAQAWNALGQLHEAKGNAASAREALERAAAADEAYLTPWVGILRLDAR